jgi:hypothetical protein
MNNISGFVGVIVGIVLLFGISLLLRELMCWYWKVNERIELQKKTNDLLIEISRRLDTNNKDSDR